MSEPPLYSNYPRPQLAAGPGLPTRPPGVYWDVFDPAYRLLTSQLGTYVLATLIFCVVAYTVSIPFSILAAFISSTPRSGDLIQALATPASPWVMIATQIVPMMVSFFLQAGLNLIAYRHAAGEKPELATMFVPLGDFGRMAGAALVYAGVYSLLMAPYMVAASTMQSTINIPTLVGCGILLLIEGLVVGGPLALYPSVVVSTRLSPLEAFVSIYRTLGWRVVSLSLLTVVTFAIACVGVLACCVGLLLTYPLAILVFSIHAYYLHPPAGTTIATKVE